MLVLFSILTGLYLKSNGFYLFGENWNYQKALYYRTQEGFYEAGFQMVAQTYLMLNQNFASLKGILPTIGK